MKKYGIFGIIALALLVASCGGNTKVSGVVSGLENTAPSVLVIKRLGAVSMETIDSLKLGNDGSFKFSLNVEKGQPQFVYLYRNDVKVASLLLQRGEKAIVAADTLGKYTVEGSEESVKLNEIEQRYASFLASMLSDSDTKSLSEKYIRYYRECVGYVVRHYNSLTVIPVLYQKVNGGASIFGQPTDAIHFRAALDSLKKVYPSSIYLESLEKETRNRENYLELRNRISNAPVSSFPDIVMTDIKGEKKALSSVDAKAVLVHFWDASDINQKMFNLDVLMPLYNDFHSKGFEIYSVCLDADKVRWGTVVTGQKLPWINVNDGKGAFTPAVYSYNVQNLPESVLILNGEICTEPIKGEKALRSVLSKNCR